MATTEELLTQILTELKGFKVAESKPIDTEAYAKFTIARMRVPKMVKNGFNSVFGIWGQF
jgi:hypothetical protein